MSDSTPIFLIVCQDPKGLVSRISGFINEYRGNILDPSILHIERRGLIYSRKIVVFD